MAMGTINLPSFKNPRFRVQIATLVIGLSLIYLTWRGGPSISFSNAVSRVGFTLPAPADTDEDIAFCISTKDQSQDLPEFLIHHYHHHGIRRFYIMDDRSNPPLSTFSDYGVPRSTLSFQYYDEKAQHPEMQSHIYGECARLYGTLHKWIAFLDVDEFIETQAPDTLHSILKELEQAEGVGALGINWRLHSSAGLQHRPESVRQSFTKCASDPEGPAPTPGWKDNRAIKSIVRTSLFEEPFSPHMFKTSNGTKTVGEHGDILEDNSNLRIPITRDRIGLHHYTTKSRDQFVEKMGTWQAEGNYAAKGWDYWHHIEGLPQIECMEMMKYNP